ncbi:THIOREDOXIN [Salix koriyanagi]|uniref:THIOREDOXIN n=1 Tax=Salix koriyanagi TaxID=2511006 RepID=A0A9Q0ZKN7_9ROSI|nr:THIOREDOXIN [Salix koriyanagi]
MESQEQQPKSRVIKVESVESWDFYSTQATNQACPIVVHFTALWCMPSVAMNPIFEELASAYPDALFLTVDVDEAKDHKFPLSLFLQAKQSGLKEVFFLFKTTLFKKKQGIFSYPAQGRPKEVAAKMEVKGHADLCADEGWC